MPGFDGKKRCFTYQTYWEYFTKVRVNQTVNQTVKFLFLSIVQELKRITDDIMKTFR